MPHGPVRHGRKVGGCISAQGMLMLSRPVHHKGAVVIKPLSAQRKSNVTWLSKTLALKKYHKTVILRSYYFYSKK